MQIVLIIIYCLLSIAIASGVVYSINYSSQLDESAYRIKFYNLLLFLLFALVVVGWPLMLIGVVLHKSYYGKGQI